MGTSEFVTKSDRTSVAWTPIGIGVDMRAICGLNPQPCGV